MGNSNLKLMLIEDSFDIGDWIRQSITSIDGIDFSEWILRGSDALEKIDKSKPDILVLDLRLPDANGLEILKSIRKENNKPLIIVFTINEQAKQRAISLGADYFFNKATEDQEFLKAVETIARLNKNRIII